MRTMKFHLLAATTIAGAVMPAVAGAQIAFPAAELRGVGASSVQTSIVQTMNCIGNPGSHAPGNTDNLNRLGTNNGSLSTVPEGVFVQTNPTAASPNFDCNLEEIQPNFEGKYVATGSGTGRSFWRLFSNQLPGTTATNQNPFGTWNNVQFALSDAPTTASELAQYDANANNATNAAGAPIQFPLYVLPVAIAYNPVYGRRRIGREVVDMTFNLKPAYVTTDAQGNPTGGIRLSKVNYCKIFNGVIVNWNDAALRTNGVGNSLRSENDDAIRWRDEGVPIRLVGRLDNSGTTDIFTRHLAAACNGVNGQPVNKFQTAAEALPFDRSSGINLSAFRSDTRYTPTSTGALAGTVQSLSGAVFIRASGGTPASINTTQGAEAPGLFMVADGSSGVRDAINYQTEPAPGNGQVALNGKLGYIGSDFVRPAPGAALFSAALQIGGVGNKYAAPTSEQGVAAFGTTNYLPPQTTSVNGAFNPNDPRTGPRRDGAAGTVPIDRANPLHWVSVLYSGDRPLSNPRTGYPITGVTMYLGYTCYATDANRLAVATLLGTYAGTLRRDSENDPVSPNLVKGTRAAALGLLAQLNLAPMPDAWLNAINETFLKNSRQGGGALGAKNLWIQSAFPTRRLDQSQPNPTCVPGRGA